MSLADCFDRRVSSRVPVHQAWAHPRHSAAISAARPGLPSRRVVISAMVYANLTVLMVYSPAVAARRLAPSIFPLVLDLKVRPVAAVRMRAPTMRGAFFGKQRLAQRRSRAARPSSSPNPTALLSGLVSTRRWCVRVSLRCARGSPAAWCSGASLASASAPTSPRLFSLTVLCATGWMERRTLCWRCLWAF